MLEQGFSTNAPNLKWAGDISFLRTDEGRLYMAVIIDLWSRSYWLIDIARMTMQLAYDALQITQWRRKRL